MDITFKRAAESDIPVIYQLADKIWHDHYPSIITTEQINYMLKARYSEAVLKEQLQLGEQIYLAFFNDTPVAFGSIELKERYYYLHKFYVEVSEHRHGIGRQFFNYLLSQTDISKPIRLQVNRQNFKAINFYFKMGFTIESVGDFHVGEGYYMNDFIMLRKPFAQ